LASFFCNYFIVINVNNHAILKKKSMIMIKMWTVLIMFAVIGLAGCSSNKGDAAGDELYIPEGYLQQLQVLELTEVAALPYFTSPFITVAEDRSGEQYAVLFDKSGEVRQEKLPVK
jgi:hypothetical protein